MARHYPPWTNQKLELYHGTSQKHAGAILNSGIDPSLGAPNTDFGRGFYVSTWLEQAREWAEAKASLLDEQPAVLKILLDRGAVASLRSMAFVRDGTDFWSFIIHSRAGNEPASESKREYDVIYGPVAKRWGPEEFRILPGFDQVAFHGVRAKDLLRDPGACTVEVLK